MRPYDIFSEAALSREFHYLIQEEADKYGLEFFSSPFDLESVDFLETLNVTRYKIASFEINHIPLISHAASKGKPMIISTGVASENDINNAIKACHEVDNHDITLLKCTSEYPAKIEDANLNRLVDMRNRFGVKVGLSDHSEGSLIPTLATALGASVIEKHFILDKALGGPDAFFSLDRREFKQMVDDVRKAEKSLGIVDYTVKESDVYRRRSIFAAEDISIGEQFSESNLCIVRPGNGIEPKHYDSILGKVAKRNILKGDPMNFDAIG